MGVMVGSRIQRFETVALLGAGGMGAVYRARDPQLARDVAIKVLTDASSDASNGLSADQTVDLRTAAAPSTESLLTEARMMAQLSHPNVLPVYEVGLTDGAVFVVMEYVDGSHLGTWLEQRPPTDAILAVFAQAARGLAAAHAAGIVHRDFKPHNVLLGRDGRVRVADFGLSRFMAHGHGSLVRVDDGLGTPKYMAPELWRGAQATPRSDVYALCVTLHEALDGHEVSPQLRALMAAGISDDPAARPDLGTILAALEGTATRRSGRWIAIGTLAVAGAVGSLLAVRTMDDRPSCTVDPSTFAGSWDADLRASTEKLLRSHATPPTAMRVDRILTTLDAHRDALTVALVATCEGEGAGKLTAVQATARRTCLDHRILELGVALRSLSTNAPEPGAFVTISEDQLDQLPRAVTCADIDVASAPLEPDKLRALYERLHRHDIPLRSAKPLIEAIEADALAAGQQEIAVRAALWLSSVERRLDQLDAADQSLQRAAKLATTIRATDLHARALVERSRLAIVRLDTTSAKSFADLANDLSDHPAVSPRTRVQIEYVRGLAVRHLADHKGAAKILREAFEHVREHGRLPQEEVGIRFQLMMTRMAFEPAPAVAEFARENVEFVRTQLGENAADLGTAYNLLGVATAPTNPEEALGHRRTALALALKAHGPGHSRVASQRLDIASALFGLDRFEEARTELARVVEDSDKNPAIAALRPHALGWLGVATFSVGKHDEALAISEQAVAESSSVHGFDHAKTIDYRQWRVFMLLELGRYDEAARLIDALERTFRKKPDEHALQLAILDGYERGLLALGRGKPKEAEERARAALPAIRELRATDLQQANVLTTLGKSLLAQRRYAEARAQILAASTLHKDTAPLARAVFDVWLAEADAGLGDTTGALTRVRAARDVLDKYPGEIEARTHADALLARLN